MGSWPLVAPHLNRVDEQVEIIKYLSGLVGLLDQGGCRYFKHTIAVLYLIEQHSQLLEGEVEILSARLRSLKAASVEEDAR